MFDGTPDADIVGDWMAKARADLKSARQLLSFANDADTCAVCFHAQQAAEKSLKALLLQSNLDPPRTHDLSALVELLPRQFAGYFDLDALDAVTQYAVTTRYPGPFEEPSYDEARTAVASAGNVYEVVAALVAGSNPSAETRPAS